MRKKKKKEKNSECMLISVCVNEGGNISLQSNEERLLAEDSED